MTDTGDWMLEDFISAENLQVVNELPHAHSQRHVLQSLYSAYMTTPIFSVASMCVYVLRMYVHYTTTYKTLFFQLKAH